MDAGILIRPATESEISAIVESILKIANAPTGDEVKLRALDVFQQLCKAPVVNLSNFTITQEGAKREP